MNISTKKEGCTLNYLKFLPYILNLNHVWKISRCHGLYLWWITSFSLQIGYRESAVLKYLKQQWKNPKSQSHRNCHFSKANMRLFNKLILCSQYLWCLILIVYARWIKKSLVRYRSMPLGMSERILEVGSWGLYLALAFSSPALCHSHYELGNFAPLCPSAVVVWAFEQPTMDWVP